MTILEMVSDVASQIGDPFMQNPLTLPIAIKRWVNEGSKVVQRAVSQIHPEHFIGESASQADASILPSDFLEMIRVYDSAAEYIHLPPDKVGAVGVSSFYPITGYFFYIKEGTAQKRFYKYPQAGSASIVYRKKARDVDYDIGVGNISTNVLTATTPGKAWPVDYWIGSNLRVLGEETYVTDSDDTTITGNSISSGTGVEYEVYIPSLVPEDYHDLITQFATAKALRSIGKVQEAALMEKNYKEGTALILGGK